MKLLLGSDFYDLVEMTMPKAIKKRIQAKRKCKKCIRQDCDQPQAAGCRELCKQHFNQWDYARRLAKARGASVLKRFEQAEIAAGRVGKSNRGRRSGNDYTLRIAAS